MLNATATRDTTMDSPHCGNHLEPTLRLRELAPPFGVGSIDLRSLPAGTEVVVETSNSRYRFITIEEGTSNVLLQGGRYFESASNVCIEGASADGCLQRVGWIAIGFGMEISMPGKRVVTSSVRSIVVDG